MLDSTIIRNISSLFSLRVAGYIIPLLTLPYLVRVLEPAGYGTLAFSFAVIQYFSIIVNYGFDLSATKKIAQEKDLLATSCIFWNVFTVKLTFASAGFSLLCFYYFISNGSSLFNQLLLISYIGVIGEAIFQQWLFQGKEQLGKVSIVRVSSQVLSVPLVFYFIKDKNDVLIAAVISILPSIFTAIFSLYLIYSNRWIVWVRPKINQMLIQIKDGWYIFLSTAAVSLYTTSVTVILGIISGPASVAIYVSANKLLQAGLSLYSPITASFYPRINNLISECQEKAVELIRYVLRLQLCLTFFIGLGIYIFSPLIVEMLFGMEYKDSSEVLRIMSILPVLIGLSNVFGMLVLLPFNYNKAFSFILAFSGAVSLIALIPLSHYFDAKGAAMSVVITELIVSLLMFFAIRKFKIPLFRN